MLTNSAIEKYFTGEKNESRVFLLIGLAAILVSIVELMVWGTLFWKGASIPLILVGLIQVSVGYTIYKRSEGDNDRVITALENDPASIQTKELPRMKVVNKNFSFIRYVEIMLIGAGIILVGLFNRDRWDNPFWFGAGIALTVQSAIMLLADYFAEKRALIYTRELEDFCRKK